MLVAQGVDAQLSLKNAYGRTPLDEAERLGDQSMISFLKPLTHLVLTVRTAANSSRVCTSTHRLLGVLRIAVAPLWLCSP